MTGQVKEVVLTRFGELGVRVRAGVLSFEPKLLRASEFLEAPGEFEYLGLDGEFKRIPVAAGELAFTYCQVPVVYRLGESTALSVWRRGAREDVGNTSALSPELSASVFARTGDVSRIQVTVRAADLTKFEKAAS
jgi:hypothetical protein